MSQLLDSLRKANRERPRARVGLSGNSRAALVISSLGLVPRRRRRIPLSGLIVVVMLTSASLAAGSLSRRITLAHDPPYASAHNNLGLLLLAQGRPDEAAARFRAAAALDGRHPGPLTNLALAHKAAGRLDQARESLLAALAISPRSAPAHYNLAVLYDRSGERARAAGHYRAFLEHRGGDHASLAADVTARLAALDAGR